MITYDDQDLRTIFAPIAADRATDVEIAALHAALIAPAPSRSPSPARPGLRWRPVAGIAAATLAAGVGLAVLPATDHSPAGNVSVLHAAAAEAAGHRVPSVTDAPYRYSKIRETFAYTARRDDATAVHTARHDSEAWVSARWTGRQDDMQGTTTTSGDAALARDLWPQGRRDPLVNQRSGPFAYGDGPLADLDPASLPADRDGIARTLRDGIDNNRWSFNEHQRGRPNAPGSPPTDSFVTYNILLLLTHARVTPQQRAALIDVLAADPSAHDLGTVHDALGRTGRGVELTYPGPQFLSGANRFTVIFDDDSSEILQWTMAPEAAAEPASHASAAPSPHLPPALARLAGTTQTMTRTVTVLTAGYVDAIGDRP